MTANNIRDIDEPTAPRPPAVLVLPGPAAILLGLLGGVLDNGWLMFAALLTLPIGMALMTGWGWCYEPQPRYRRMAAALTIAAVAAWFATVWLLGFPPAMVRFALTIAGLAAIAAAGIWMSRRTRGCFPAVVGGPSAAGARALLDDTDRPGTDGGDLR